MVDYSIILIFLLVILAFSYQIYYNYFRTGNKISDKELMQNYIFLKMKQNKRVYFPSFDISKWENV